ncbi:MAG TPA: hypothetical protein VK578_09940 [Edaphobacter sp.]|nr:hypothetical protein [Edaphobacter sp.]
MSDLTFAQPARRNLLAPVLIAFVILGIVIALVLRYTPHKTADITVTATSVYPAHTVFKSDSILVGSDRSQDDLYVLATIRIEDRLNLPLFLKDFTATLVTADGQEFHTSGVEKQDIPSLLVTFPALEKLASPPLLRETLIAPGQSAEGMVLLHFPVTQAVWNTRKSAVLSIDLYHQGPLSIPIPNPGQRSVALTDTSRNTLDE